MRVSLASVLLGLAWPAQAASGDGAQGYLERMASVDTGHGAELPLLEETAAYLKQAGLYAQVHPSAAGRGNLVARLEPTVPSPGPRLVVVGHVDTRPCAADALKVVEREGTLSGCGVGEGKAFAAAAVAALLELQRSAPRRSREVDLVLTSDGLGSGQAGITHLASVLPTLLDGATVMFAGGFSDGGTVVLHRTSKARVDFRLVAHGKPTALGFPSTESAPGILAQAMARVEAHRFPLHATGALVATLEPWGRSSTDVVEGPAVAALLTTCQVVGMDVPPSDGVPEKAAAKVVCLLAPSEEQSQVAWQMVDIVKDPRVVVERVIQPRPAPPVLPGPPWNAALSSAWPQARLVPAALPARGGMDTVLRQGNGLGVPLFQGPTPDTLTVASWNVDRDRLQNLLNAAVAP